MDTRALLEELLDFIDPVVDGLGSREELRTVRWILEHGTGADRQLAAYQRGQTMKSMVDHLIEETSQGLPISQLVARC